MSNLNMVENLRVVILAKNRIEGEFPDFSSSTHLENVDVSDNLLEGEIFDVFGSVSVILNIKGNRWVGWRAYRSVRLS